MTNLTQREYKLAGGHTSATAGTCGRRDFLSDWTGMSQPVRRLAETILCRPDRLSHVAVHFNRAPAVELEVLRLRVAIGLIGGHHALFLGKEVSCPIYI